MRLRPIRRRSAGARVLGSVAVSAAALSIAMSQTGAVVRPVAGGGLHAAMSRTNQHVRLTGTSSGGLAGGGKPTIRTAVAFGTSRPARALAVLKQRTGPFIGRVEGNGTAGPPSIPSSTVADGALQSSPPSSPIPPTSQNFEGVDVGQSSSDVLFVGAPPDTNGDVGPSNYVQIVNTVFAVFSKTGTLQSGPTPINQLWASAGNSGQFNCTAQSRGDPIVKYDRLADRWMISQFNFPGGTTIAPPFDQCFAISTTSDPTGSYYLYDFRYSTTIFNDYPHIGIWPDGYYMSVNQYDTSNNETFHSAGACSFERSKMLAGDSSAQSVCFDESTIDPQTRNSGGYHPLEGNSPYLYHGQLPSDLDGTSRPPSGEPNFFMQMLDSTSAGQDKLLEFKFHVDWAHPASSWFGSGPGNTAPVQIPVADFSTPCNSENATGDRNCIPQKDATPQPYTDPNDPTSTVTDYLDSIGDRLMYRLAYRNFGDHESLVLNHTVSAGPGDTFVGNGQAGIRWYEIRNPNGTPSVYQQSTFAPDSAHRWMGSVAMDQAGDIALGYSKSSATTYPSINYVARRASDPLGTMTLGEGTIINGTGAQQGTGNRWGDYSSLAVDPNGCTFWYTTEYYAGTGSFGWNTRIGSFTLPSCGDPQLTMSGPTQPQRIGTDYSYTIGVTTGQSQETGVTVTDKIPSGATLLAASPSTGTCLLTAPLTCNLGTLGPGSLTTITVTVHANSAGDLANTASLAVASPVDPNTSNNTATVHTTVFDPCSAPGEIVVTDAAGDALDQQADHDIRNISVAEPFAGGANVLAFGLKVQDLSSPSPNTTWPIYFTSSDDKTYFVSMDTSGTGAVSYSYGTVAHPGSLGAYYGATTTLGAADAGSGFTPGGQITILIDPAKVGDPHVGQDVSKFQTRITVHGGAVNPTPDNAPDSVSAPEGTYTRSGNAFCAPNTAPTAALAATPTTGAPPLAVQFDGSGSSDPDTGDTVASYTFDFGDGSAKVTQSTPTVTHTYGSAGTYHATLSVTDSRGMASSTPASQDVVVSGGSTGADLAVRVFGPRGALARHPIAYRIRVRNNGPQAATRVVVRDGVPKHAAFVSAKSSLGTCTWQSRRHVLVCRIPTLASGARVRIRLVVRPAWPGLVRNTARVRASSPKDPVRGNNRRTIATKVS